MITLIAVWLTGAVIVAFISAIVWAILRLMDDESYADVYAARVFLLSPLWPLMVLWLGIMMVRDAFVKVED